MDKLEGTRAVHLYQGYATSHPLSQMTMTPPPPPTGCDI